MLTQVCWEKGVHSPHRTIFRSKLYINIFILHLQMKNLYYIQKTSNISYLHTKMNRYFPLTLNSCSSATLVMSCCVGPVLYQIYYCCIWMWHKHCVCVLCIILGCVCVEACFVLTNKIFEHFVVVCLHQLFPLTRVLLTSLFTLYWLEQVATQIAALHNFWIVFDIYWESIFCGQTLICTLL